MTEGASIAACRCGAQLAPELLSCPACHRLVHTAELKQRVSDADALESEGRIRDAVGELRCVLDLLPSGSRQHAVVRDRVQRLSDRIDAGEVEPDAAPANRAVSGTPDRGRASSRSSLLKSGSALGAGALLLWKFKAIGIFIATKAKLLLLGLSKSSTLFSMLLSLGLYWTIWGWQFAAGLVLSLYVHEMGHVAALQRFGIRASAPMFIPGLGAMVRMNQYPQTAREEARVGLAGPIWGLGASLAALAGYGVTGFGILAAIGTVGAWINLFNLIPFWHLDGGRGFRSLSRRERWLATAAIGLAFAATMEGMLVLLLIAGVLRSLAKDAPEEGDSRGLVTYAALVVSLALLSSIPVPTSG